MRRKRNAVVAAVLAAVMLAGCGSSGATAASSAAAGSTASGTSAASTAESSSTNAGGTVKDTVTVVLKGEPSNIDPCGNTELVAQAVQVQIFDTLVKKDENGEIVPSLAESWEQVDDTTWRFHLRDDVYFHNGEKMTADDVVYSIKRATEMPSSASIFQSFDGDNTAAVDDTTVDIKTKTPFAALLNYLCSTRGEIVSKKAVEEMGDDAFGRAPVGTGPFKFDNWVTGTDITLTRNDDYWGDKPAYSTLDMKFISETANRALEIEAGNADIVLDPDTTDLDRLKEEDGIEVVTGDSYGFSFIVFSMDDPVVSNEKVRQALSLALDLDSIVESVYGSYATVSESVMPSTILYYKSQGTHEYDPEKAKQLLADAGYPDGLDIKLSAPDGAEQQNIAVIVQNMWKEIGVNAEIATATTSEVLAAGRRGENQATVMGGTFSTGDPGHALADFDTGSDGYFRPNDTHIDELLEKGASTFDDDDRRAVYEELQEYIYNQYYLIGIANRTVNYLITDKVENFYCDPGDIPSFANVVVYE